MRSGCRGFESRSGHLIFSSICSVYIDRHIRVDLSDDEQVCSKYAVLHTMCMVYTSGPMSIVYVSTINRSNSQSERPGSKCLVIDVSFVANIRLTPLWLPR